METTHGELQQYHNKEVTKNLDYRMEGMVDVNREELSGYLIVESSYGIGTDYAPADEPWTQTQWDIINQMRAELTHIHIEIANLEKLFDVSSKPIKKGKYKKYDK